MLLYFLSRIYGRILHPIGWVRILVARDGKELGAKIHVWPPCKLSAWFSLSSFCWHVCLFMTIPNFGIKLTFASFQNAIKHWFDRLPVWRFRTVIWTKDPVRFLCSHCLCYLVFRFNFQQISLNHHSANRNWRAQNYKNSLLNVCGWFLWLMVMEMWTSQ